MSDKIKKNLQELLEDLDKKYCYLIFKDSWEKKDREKLINHMKATKSKPLNGEWTIPYERITKTIYESDIQEYEKIGARFDELFDDSDKPADLVSYCNKLKHDTLKMIKLAVIQKKHIIAEVEKADKKAKKAQNLADNAVSIINDTKEKTLNEVKSTKKVVYTNFIAIFGIFTAITFATFGGLQLIGNALDNLTDKMNSYQIGGVLIISSIILLATYVILMALVVSLSKLISGDKNKRYEFSPEVTISISLTIATIFVIGCFFIILTCK